MEEWACRVEGTCRDGEVGKWRGGEVARWRGELVDRKTCREVVGREVTGGEVKRCR